MMKGLLIRTVEHHTVGQAWVITDHTCQVPTQTQATLTDQSEPRSSTDLVLCRNALLHSNYFVYYSSNEGFEYMSFQ